MTDKSADEPYSKERKEMAACSATKNAVNKLNFLKARELDKPIFFFYHLLYILGLSEPTMHCAVDSLLDHLRTFLEGCQGL